MELQIMVIYTTGFGALRRKAYRKSYYTRILQKQSVLYETLPYHYLGVTLQYTWIITSRQYLYLQNYDSVNLVP